jgi:hypothetical protein
MSAPQNQSFASAPCFVLILVHSRLNGKVAEEVFYPLSESLGEHSLNVGEKLFIGFDTSQIIPETFSTSRL